MEEAEKAKMDTTNISIFDVQIVKIVIDIYICLLLYFSKFRIFHIENDYELIQKFH